MADKSIVPAHDEVRKLVDIIHYDSHPDRVESALFRANKEALHEAIKAGKTPACFIDNGYCEGHTEIHHYLVEYSAGNEIEWAKVNGVIQMIKPNSATVHDPDEMGNLIPLCHKHHMGVGTGIHMVTFPAWILQKFLNDGNLALFEEAVKVLKAEKHPNHADKSHPDHQAVNAKAGAILHKLASTTKVS